ncbi:DUF397 domain-containing protein [Micromonospora sp. WMMD1102]|uniref:DUF397 domain-containing protein n=1 Tax=Micromonospora sp. WMMD1102 TaxID=3016105 RepID=UPI00241581CA|nr:DUF397 domain-containing protein [Micromonospora sp. WMMD1102]MDG4790741.1 DUF397 domain-containing protein [Micromonospora sp. WMMD1102]MDG4792188.1 DUF397 domain-containing protein [Micromonospora sp. WMMD1102]
MDVRTLTWRKSSRSSGGGNNDCVEVAAATGLVAVRDSKRPEAAVLCFSPGTWRAFVAASKSGTFDRP